MNVIIFGTGSFYKKYKEQLVKKEINIVAFADNDPDKQGTIFEGKQVISPAKINQVEYDYIIIANSFWIAIETQLLKMGIEQDTIWIPFLREIISSEDDKLNKVEIKRLVEKNGESKRKALSIIIENGLSTFIDRFKEYWEGEYDIYCFNLDAVSSRRYLKEIMLHSDLCFFEWCGGALAYGSNLAEAANIPIICRIHRYEVFSQHLNIVNWENVDKAVFIAEHICSLFISKTKFPQKKTALIYNGFDFRRFNYKNRTRGFKIAYLGALIYRKAPEMLLQVMKKLVDIDYRYKLYLAGENPTKEIEIYLDYMLKEMGLQNNVMYDGFQANVDQWLEDKDYIICSSIGEGHITAIQEAMIKGIKPIIHNYPGAKELYGPEHLWNTIDEAVELITKSPYNSKHYHDMIFGQFELSHKAQEFKGLFRRLLEEHSGY